MSQGTRNSSKGRTNNYTLFKVYEEKQYQDLLAFRAKINEALKKRDVEKLVPAPPLNQIAFKGGGAKGAAYPGAISSLEELGFIEEIDLVIGTSAGAITALILGLGFSAEQFRQLSDKVSFTDFADIKPNGWGAFFNGNRLGNALDLIQYGGVFTGESFHQFATYLIEQMLGSPNATFADLHNARMLDPALKDMVFKATRYNARPGEIVEQTFSYLDTPNVRIADAVRASMAFPGAFLPFTVREKNGQVFGVFADGGILSNWPIDAANRKEYYDPKYLPVEKLDHLGKPHQINPCAVGLNLVSNLEHLDDRITPFSPRLRRIRDQKFKGRPKTREQSREEEINDQLEQGASWRYHDIVKGIVWHKIGSPIREDMREKQALYEDQCVQIWCEEVGTLEFDASKKKLANIYLSGKAAMRNWLRKNKDPAIPYTYPDHFDDRLTNADKILRNENPREFYLEKLTDCYMQLFAEMKKMEMQKKHSDENLIKNVKVLYLSKKINEFLEKINKPPLNAYNIDSAAFENAKVKFNQREHYMAQRRADRQNLISDDLIVQAVAVKLKNNPPEALRMLKGQLSSVMKIILSKQGSNLLSVVVQLGNHDVAAEFFNIVKNAYQQCYYQGKKDYIKNNLSNMLNEFAHPGVFHVLAGQSNTQMVLLLMRNGADPLAVNAASQTNGLQEMIIANDYASFKTIINYCVSRGIDIKNIRFGSQSIGHFILNNANNEFIHQLIKEPKLAKSVLHFHAKDIYYNDIVQLAALLSSDENDSKWNLVRETSTSRLAFSKAKQQGLTNYTVHKAKAESAYQTYHAILSAENPIAMISALKPQECFTILNTNVKGILRLSALMKDPAKADILIALCERAGKNGTYFKQLRQLFSQKFYGETSLYTAAKAGNTKVVKYLRLPKYDIDINRAGPIDTPCALLAAAKEGHSEVVSALVSSIPYGLRIGYHSVSRRKQDPHDLKTPLHHLAMYGTPKAFCDLLYGGGMRSSPTKVAMMKDRYGKTPISYLIEFDRIDILEEIINRGKKARKGFFYNSDYHFATLFGWNANNEESIADLELARRINPKIFTYLCLNLTGVEVKKQKIMNCVAKHAAQENERKSARTMSLTTEMKNRELAVIGESEYDDMLISKKGSYDLNRSTVLVRGLQENVPPNQPIDDKSVEKKPSSSTTRPFKK